MTQDEYLSADLDDPRVLDWQQIYDERQKRMLSQQHHGGSDDEHFLGYGHDYDEPIIHSSGEAFQDL